MIDLRFYGDAVSQLWIISTCILQYFIGGAAANQIKELVASGLVSSRFLIRAVHAFLVSPCVLCVQHTILVYLNVLTMFHEDHTTVPHGIIQTISSLLQIFPVQLLFPLPGSEHLRRVPCSQAHSI
jgi:hypothetical protein